jgi:hypothetical protein
MLKSTVAAGCIALATLLSSTTLAEEPQTEEAGVYCSSIIDAMLLGNYGTQLLSRGIEFDVVRALMLARQNGGQLTSCQIRKVSEFQHVEGRDGNLVSLNTPDAMAISDFTEVDTKTTWHAPTAVWLQDQ